MRPEDEDVGDVVRRLAPAGRPAGDACPDANALAAFAEGGGPAGERRLIEAHLASCEACRAILRETSVDLAGAGAEARPAAARSSAWFAPPLAVAAVLLLVLGGVAALLLQDRGTPTSEPGGTLASAAETLRSARPDLFAGFEPLSPEEIAAAAPTRPRGWGVLRPAEVVRSGPVTFAWRRAPGATGYDVAVVTADARPLWRRTVGNVDAMDYPPDAPPLAPGTAYVVAVTTRGPLGRDEATRRFAVATPDEEARLSAGFEEIDRLAPADARPVLRAHWALRRGFVIEAEHLLRERLRGAPDDAAARELLRYASRRLGADDE